MAYESVSDIIGKGFKYEEREKISRIQEILSGTLAAFVGGANWGPVNIPTLVLKDFASFYGSPLVKNDGADFSGQAATYALDYSPFCWFTRVADGSETYAQYNIFKAAVAAEIVGDTMLNGSKFAIYSSNETEYGVAKTKNNQLLFGIQTPATGAPGNDVPVSLVSTPRCSPIESAVTAFPSVAGESSVSTMWNYSVGDIINFSVDGFDFRYIIKSEFVTGTRNPNEPDFTNLVVPLTGNFSSDYSTTAVPANFSGTFAIPDTAAIAAAFTGTFATPDTPAVPAAYTGTFALPDTAAVAATFTGTFDLPDSPAVPATYTGTFALPDTPAVAATYTGTFLLPDVPAVAAEFGPDTFSVQGTKSSFSGTVLMEAPNGPSQTVTITCNTTGTAGNVTITGNGTLTLAQLVPAGYTLTTGTGTWVPTSGQNLSTTGGANDTTSTSITITADVAGLAGNAVITGNGVLSLNALLLAEGAYTIDTPAEGLKIVADGETLTLAGGLDADTAVESTSVTITATTAGIIGNDSVEGDGLATLTTLLGADYTVSSGNGSQIVKNGEIITMSGGVDAILNTSTSVTIVAATPGTAGNGFVTGNGTSTLAILLGATYNVTVGDGAQVVKTGTTVTMSGGLNITLNTSTSVTVTASVAGAAGNVVITGDGTKTLAVLITELLPVAYVVVGNSSQIVKNAETITVAGGTNVITNTSTSVTITANVGGDEGNAIVTGNGILTLATLVASLSPVLYTIVGNGAQIVKSGIAITIAGGVDIILNTSTAVTLTSNTAGTVGNRTITGNGTDTIAALCGVTETVTAGNGAQIVKSGTTVLIAGGVNAVANTSTEVLVVCTATGVIGNNSVVGNGTSTLAQLVTALPADYTITGDGAQIVKNAETITIDGGTADGIGDWAVYTPSVAANTYLKRLAYALKRFVIIPELTRLGLSSPSTLADAMASIGTGQLLFASSKRGANSFIKIFMFPKIFTATNSVPLISSSQDTDIAEIITQIHNAIQIAQPLSATVSLDPEFYTFTITSFAGGITSGLEIKTIANNFYTQLGLTVDDMVYGIDAIADAGTLRALSTGSDGNTIIFDKTKTSDGYTLTIYFRGFNIASFFNYSYNINASNYIGTLMARNDQVKNIVAFEAPVGVTDVPPFAYGTMTLGGGTSGVTAISDVRYNFALDEYKNIDLYNVDIVCVSGHTAQIVQDKVEEICTYRRDCFGIVDAPENIAGTVEMGANIYSMIDWTNGVASTGRNKKLESNFLATYFPWISIPDGTVDQDSTWYAPSVRVVGAICNCDKLNGNKMSAPAGNLNAPLNKITALAQYLREDEKNRLYADELGNNVNPLVFTTTRGFFIDGQKTTNRSTGAVSRLNVLRTSLYIKKRMYEIAPNYFWKPLTKRTQDEMAAELKTICEYLVSITAIKPDYVVICDDTINSTQTEALRGLIGLVEWTPVRSIEKIKVISVIRDLKVEVQFA